MRIARSEERAAPTSGRATQSMVRELAIVLVSVGVATLSTMLLAPFISRAAFVFLYVAVALSAGFAGVAGGVLATVLGTLVIEFFVIPRSDVFGVQHPHDAISLVVFVVVSALIVALTATTAAVRERAMAATVDLQRANDDLATALEEANHARQDAMEHAERLRLLDEASSILASSLDYETTLAATARLVVPRLADWCSVDVLVGSEIKQLASKYIDTPGLKRMSDLRARQPHSAAASTGVARVIRTGESLFMPKVSDAFLAAQARSPEHLESLVSLGIQSALIVPMVARGNIIGSLLLVSLRNSRTFDKGLLALARDIARRSAVAIDNAQLYQTAVTANASKANFLATMSHELRTPLTAIIGYESLLAEGIAGEVNAEQGKQLERIKVSAHQLLALIEEILLYARVEAGRESVNFAEVNAQKVVDDALVVVAPLAQTRGLSLTADPIAPALTLRTDASKLRQMLINLLANAVKFTENGTIVVRAYSRNADVVFEVQDTGIGIAPENLENIFEAFWQVEQSRTRKAGGSGLGLSTTRQLAKVLGGDVSVQSEQQVGSTFQIVLPKEPPPQTTK